MPILCTDCFSPEGLPSIEDGSIDLVICDPPYGITGRNAWDVKLDMQQLLPELFRVIKPTGTIVIFSQGMLTAEIMTIGQKYWRYNLIWQKNKPRGFLNAKKRPLTYHEDLIIFYKKPGIYHPQMIETGKPVHYCKRKATSSNYGEGEGGVNSRSGKTDRYPGSILSFPVLEARDPERIHPTQKPVDLYSFLIKSYSNENNIVLDPCSGSGTAAVAAVLNDRRYICFEKDIDIHQSSVTRLSKYESIVE